MKKIVRATFCLMLTAIVLSGCFCAFAEDKVLGDNITYKVEGTTLTLEGSGDMSLSYDYLTEIPWHNDGKNIETLIVGEGITSIAEGAFSAFTKLQTVVLPETLQVIGTSAFISCTSLEELIIPTRVTKIGVGAFAGCENLETVIIQGGVENISSDAFYDCPYVMIVCIKNSYAHKFAEERNIVFDSSLLPSSEILVKLNGKFLFFDQPPVIVDDRTLVPFRTIFEELGAEVNWIAEERKVLASRDGIEISLVIDSNTLIKNGEEITIDSPAKIVNDRTMVPARAVSEALGAMVDWDPVTRTVLIDE